jgi:hypothetical protein
LKSQKILLDIEDDDEEITLGLVRLAKEIPEHELFYQLNILNSFQFSRIKDLVYNGVYYDYSFPRFEGFHRDSKVCIQFIANKSSQYIQKKVSTELFSGEQETKFLLDHFQDVDYLLKTSEPFGDFSLILLPENMMFQIQSFPLSPIEELYHIFQYYE